MRKHWNIWFIKNFLRLTILFSIWFQLCPFPSKYIRITWKRYNMNVTFLMGTNGLVFNHRQTDQQLILLDCRFTFLLILYNIWKCNINFSFFANNREKGHWSNIQDRLITYKPYYLITVPLLINLIDTLHV